MKTIIFDMGMVLVNFRWRNLLDDMGYDKKKKEGLAKAMFQSPLWEDFDWGIRGDETIFAQMKKEAPEYVEEMNHIWKHFYEICVPFDYSEDLVSTLHEKGFKIYILSNYGKTLLEHTRPNFPFLSLVDGEVFSFDVHQIKPHRDIYETLLKRYDISPENAVFFDDLKANCEAAKALGIDAVHVKDGLASILEGLERKCDVSLPELKKYMGDRR